MPSLKRLFGSPFGIHKKHKDRTSPTKRKPKTSETSVEQPSSPVTISTAATITDRDQQSTREEEYSSFDRAFSASDDSGDDDFRTTVMTSTFLDVCSTASINGSDDISDDFRTTILESTSRSPCSNDYISDDFRTTILECSNDLVYGNKDDDDDSGDDSGDDFRTTATGSESTNTYTTGRVNGNDDDNIDNDDDGDDDDDGDFRTTVFELNSVDAEIDDFKTTVIAPECEVGNAGIGTHDDHRAEENSKLQLDYFSTADTMSNLNLNADQQHHESPINAVVFENRVETGNHNIDSTNQLLPILSPCSFDDDHNLSDFDDYRSTISALTEVTTLQVRGKKKAHKPILPPPPPSPSESVNSAGAQKLEAFLKTETEAIRQLLATVSSGDDDSTVVEESNHGVNEAERMAREMEREMELLVQGHHGLLETTTNNNNNTADDDHFEGGIPNSHFSSDIACVGSPQSVCLRPPRDTPESNEFIANMRSVIHPSDDEVVVFGHHIDDQMENLHNSFSQRSNRSPGSPRSTCSSPRKDLFRKRGSLYQLKQQDIERKKKSKRKKLRRKLRFILRALVVSFVLSSVAFLVNWQWRFSDQDVSTAAKSTMAQLETTMRTGMDPKKREEAVALLTRTTKVTHSYLVEILPTSEIGRAKDLMIGTLRQTSWYAFQEAKYYAPIALRHTKLHLSRGVKATNAFALRQLDSYVWDTDTKALFSDSLEATDRFVRDRLEYAFTDRGVREQHEQEERRLQQLMEVAAAAAAMEASDKQKELWTQTMVAGACAFVGSVATNYVWALL